MLCEGGKTLLSGFPEALMDYTQRRLEKLGVEVLTGTPVDTVDADGVVAGGQRIAAANVLWCAGTAATKAADWVGAAKGKGGGVAVAPDCSVPGVADVFAVGDVMAMTDGEGKPLPGVAPVAKQQGAYVAKVIVARLAGKPAPAPFRYKDEGQLAMVGRSAAVADLGWVKLTGVLGWLFWSAVHLFFLIGARNRVAVYLSWVWAWLTYGRGARLITSIDSQTRAEAAFMYSKYGKQDGAAAPTRPAA